MNIFEKVNQYRDKIHNNSVLIEFDLYYNGIFEQHCSFAIDEQEELEAFNNVIKKLKEKDENAEVYVSTYGIDLANDWGCIYADALWIDTKLDIEELYDLFEHSREVEPSAIMLLTEDETISVETVMVFSSDGTVQDYMAFVKNRRLSNVKNLYWD